jgi:DNA ligase (NAD+)
VNEKKELAFTRGDGESGQESSEHYKFIENKINGNDLPFEYSYGEVIMPKQTFNDKYADKFANPRNLVAGLLNSKEGFESLSDCVYIRYGIQNITKNIFSTKTQVLDYLNNLQQTKVKYKVFRISDLNEQLLIDTFKEWSSEFEIDGLIIEVNDLNKQVVLGRETSTNNPVWARAFKHTSFEQAVISEVVGITWNISKQGYLKPIINIKPVRIDGVTVSNVTGNNARYIKEMGIGIDSIVKVVRSGMVIPKILEVIKKVDFVMPNIPNISWDDRGIDLITLAETDDQKFKQIVSFFSILETENVSEGVLKQLWDNGFNTIKDILNLKKEDLSKLEGFGQRKAEIVFNSIQKSIINVELSKLQHASGMFPGLGSKKLALLEHFNSKPTLEQVMSIDGFAEKSAKVYVDNYDNFNTFVKDLPITLNVKAVVSTDNLPLDGKSFVFTGIRLKDAEQTIENKGGRIVSSISKNTTYLVCKDVDGTSSKLEKARSLGVTIISVEQLMNIIK